MGMEGWFKGKEKKVQTDQEKHRERVAKDEKNAERDGKILLGAAALAATAAGAIGGAEMKISEHAPPDNAAVPNFDTMPVGSESPIAGKMPGDAPDTVTVPAH
ncbi:MAG: hypothetical protein JWM39_140 [Parcubacteria group bacterium]|nr:hypothetical protein [Parcubacteria group bacterium]